MFLTIDTVNRIAPGSDFVFGSPFDLYFDTSQMKKKRRMGVSIELERVYINCLNESIQSWSKSPRVENQLSAPVSLGASESIKSLETR